MAHPVSTMPYPERFNVAARHIQPQLEGNGSLSNEIKLALYALHQQATVGPCNQPKPWGWNAANNARWQAWKELGDLSQMEAMRLYVRTLDEESPGWVKGISTDDLQSETSTTDDALNGIDAAAQEQEQPSPVKKPATGIKTRSVAEVVVEGSWVSPYIVSPRRPPPRYEHAVALLGSRMYIMGGCYSGRYLRDVWALDLETLAWAHVTPADPDLGLAPLAGHTAVAWGSGILVVGGHAKARAPGPHISVRLLDIVSGNWRELSTSWAAAEKKKEEISDEDDDSEEDLSSTSPLPVPRGGHSSVLIGSSLWIFGGEDTSRRALGELLVLDLPSLTWRAPETTGPAPPPRTAHVASVWRERYMLIFGGGSVAHCFDDLYVLDTLTLRWSKPSAEGPVPPPRAGHAAAVLGSTWYIVGGGNNAAGCNDMYSLDLSALGARSDPDSDDAIALSWSLVGRTPPESAVASEGLSLLPVPMAGCLVAFGGYNGRYNAAVHVYRPEGYVVVKGYHSYHHHQVPANQIEEGSPTTIPAAAAAGTASTAVDDTAAARETTPASRREALVSRESASQELAVTRRQLAVTQAALAEAEALAREREAALEAERERAIKLEVETAELRAALSRMGELERELESYRNKAAADVQEQQAEAKPRSLWGFISGADSGTEQEQSI